MADQAQKLRDLKKENNDRSTNSEKKVPRIITVTSGKGGVGKSNLVVNLGLALSQRGLKVILLDADFGMANIDIILGLMPRYSMHNVISGEKKLSEVIIDGPMGMKIIPGGTGLMDMDGMQNEQREKLINELMEIEKEADLVLVDTGAGISRTVIGFVTAADEVIVMTTLEPTAIADAYSVIKVVSNHKIHQSINMVVNQVNNSQEGQDLAGHFKRVADKFLHVDIEYLGEILSDSAVTKSVRAQEPFYTSYPRSKATNCIEAIANKLVKDVPAEEVKSVTGFFKRLSKIFS